MSSQLVHHDLWTGSVSFSARLRSLGVLIVRCDEAGDLRERRPEPSDWFADLCLRSPLFRGALTEAAGRWRDETHPSVVEALPGLYLVPSTVTVRRQRLGYQVAVLPTGGFVGSEQLSAMCQAAELDGQSIRAMLEGLPPIEASEVGRIAAMVRFAHEDQSQLTTGSENMDHLGQELAESYEEISLLYTIIQNMRVVGRPARFITMACEELLATLSFSWIGVQLSDRSERLKRLSGRLFIVGEPTVDRGALQAPLQQLLAQADPETPRVLEPLQRPTHRAFRDLGPSVLVHPISSDGDVLGVLVAGEKQGSDPGVTSVDMKLIGATTSNMAIFLENAALYEDLNAMFLGTLEALAAAIDAKDRYTSGHSMRVARLTAQLATEVGLEERTIERMHIAALVHDIGKIGVPESVLLKPGKLTDEEFAWIRKHPEIGHRILKDIPQLQDILPGVLYHHERWDGRGYPMGLEGMEIPLVARIIAMADSFDAMSSQRTYRAPLSRSQVLEEIARCSGTQFDAELVECFLRLDFSDYDELVSVHRQELRTDGEAA